MQFPEGMIFWRSGAVSVADVIQRGSAAVESFKTAHLATKVGCEVWTRSGHDENGTEARGALQRRRRRPLEPLHGWVFFNWRLFVSSGSLLFTPMWSCLLLRRRWRPTWRQRTVTGCMLMRWGHLGFYYTGGGGASAVKGPGLARCCADGKHTHTHTLLTAVVWRRAAILWLCCFFMCSR